MGAAIHGTIARVGTRADMTDRNAPSVGHSSLGPGRTAGRAWLAAALLIGATVGALRLEGRRWWCAGGEPWIWVSNVWSSHCSQHVFDPYSLTHVSHGLIFFAALLWLRPRWPVRWRLVVAIGIAAAWEVLENSPLVINRYRAATMSLDYLGDSVTNSLGDILSCLIGFALAARIGVLRSLAVLVALELLLLVLIRDNLTLNVLMLIHPVEAVKVWQSAGH
jgi:hypothetical protein